MRLFTSLDFEYGKFFPISKLESYGSGVIRMLANFYRAIETFNLDTIIRGFEYGKILSNFKGILWIKCDSNAC